MMFTIKLKLSTQCANEQTNFEELHCYHLLSSDKVSSQINECIIFEPTELYITLSILGNNSVIR